MGNLRESEHLQHCLVSRTKKAAAGMQDTTKQGVVNKRSWIHSYILPFPLLITSVFVEQNDCNNIFQCLFGIFAVGLAKFDSECGLWIITA